MAIEKWSNKSVVRWAAVGWLSIAVISAVSMMPAELASFGGLLLGTVVGTIATILASAVCIEWWLDS